MRDAVICEPVRTPVGRLGGQFRAVSGTQLAVELVTALLARAGVVPDLIDDVILGQCHPNGESPAIGRVVALDAGLPVSTGGYQIDRRCGSGLQAIISAAMHVQTGASNVVIAGGVESMSHVEWYTLKGRPHDTQSEVEWLDRLVRARITAGGVRYPLPGGMVETAENLRREYSISRQQQDELALESHRRAVRAQNAGIFSKEIVPISVPGSEQIGKISSDEHPRVDASFDALAKLRPIMLEDDPAATVTPGNASGQNDGAAMCLVTFPEMAAELGLKPLARLRSWAIAGVEPSRMGIAPVAATAKVLELAGLRLSDVSLIELNEAFAAQVLACAHEWKFADGDFARMNVHGSGISLGHPLGATGARIAATLLWEMERQEHQFGLETMCIGGGQGIAAIFERTA